VVIRRPGPRERELPDPGQESVWDYPRPPRLEPAGVRIEIVLGGVPVVSTDAALRVLETSHPPTYYLPESDFAPGSLRPAGGGSFCEWKGQAAYYDVVAGGVVAERAGWTYPAPTPPYEALAGHVAVYAAPMDRCTVDGEVARPQPGGFYGGWVTSKVVGPFKGMPGTQFW
jgi:uncharacterized protein (DUF427 family)